jgi:hypothetical protein
MNIHKKIIIGLLIGLPLVVGAVNITVPQSLQKGNIPVGNANGTYNSGFLVAGSNITISTSTTGQIMITGTGGGSSFAYPFPSNATTTILDFTNSFKTSSLSQGFGFIGSGGLFNTIAS